MTLPMIFCDNRMCNFVMIHIRVLMSALVAEMAFASCIIHGGMEDRQSQRNGYVVPEQLEESHQALVDKKENQQLDQTSAFKGYGLVHLSPNSKAKNEAFRSHKVGLQYCSNKVQLTFGDEQTGFYYVKPEGNQVFFYPVPDPRCEAVVRLKIHPTDVIPLGHNSKPSRKTFIVTKPYRIRILVGCELDFNLTEIPEKYQGVYYMPRRLHEQDVCCSLIRIPDSLE